ncbi:MAG: hypothetical protein JSU78_02785, partial [Deltaproteobacteria bacterium]
LIFLDFQIILLYYSLKFFLQSADLHLMNYPAASCRVSCGNTSFISPLPNPLPKERELKGNPVASYRE